MSRAEPLRIPRQTLAHALKTALANVRHGADLLADGSLGPMPEVQREVARIVQQNSTRLQGLVERLLEGPRAPSPRRRRGGRAGAR